MPNTTRPAPDARTKAAAQAVVEAMPTGELHLSGVPTPLPPEAAAILREALAALAAGTTPSLLPTMTLDEVAASLATKGDVARLVERGRLLPREAGDQRLFPTAEVMTYAVESRHQAIKAMANMARLDQEMGRYDEPPAPGFPLSGHAPSEGNSLDTRRMK